MSNRGKRGRLSLVGRLSRALINGTDTKLRHHEIKIVLAALGEARKAATVPETPVGWQDISTHDNTADEVLVSVPGRKTPVVAWRHHPSSLTDTWLTVPGAWQVKPTHFAPLLAPPEASRSVEPKT